MKLPAIVNLACWAIIIYVMHETVGARSIWAWACIFLYLILSNTKLVVNRKDGR